MINVLVNDSYETERISKNVLHYFGDRVVCYENDSPEDIKIDVFILSGMDVLRGGKSQIEYLKSSKGSKNAKFLATSVLDDVLLLIRNNHQLTIDFTIPKDVLTVFLGSNTEKHKHAIIILNEIFDSVS